MSSTNYKLLSMSYARRMTYFAEWCNLVVMFLGRFKTFIKLIAVLNALY